MDVRARDERNEEEMKFPNVGLKFRRKRSVRDKTTITGTTPRSY